VAALLDIMADERPPAEKAQLVALVEIIERLSAARTAEDVAAVVRRVARRACGADGVTVVLREADECRYVDEDAIGPLWKGRRFPIDRCISGWVMLNGQTAVIPDIYRDPRVPHEAYRPTFVNSLVMTPVRPEAPIAAIGAYWAEAREFSAEELATLEVVARATATALENVRLIGSLNEALAQRDGLIRELDHRVKNNLASVRAIAQQTLRSATSPDSFTRSFNGRLLALARAHELVARAKGDGVGLKEAVLEGLGDDVAGRVRVEGPQVRLSPETAVNVVLALHELVANALAHGALLAPEGRVAVSWSMHDGRLELSWRELDGRPVQASGRQGFGLRMLRAALPRSLAGAADLEFAEEGLRYRISAPLSAAVRAEAPH